MMVSMPVLFAKCIALASRSAISLRFFCLEVNGTYYMAEHGALDPKSRHHSGAFRKRFASAFFCLYQLPQRIDAREGAVGVGSRHHEAVVTPRLPF